MKYTLEITSNTHITFEQLRARFESDDAFLCRLIAAYEHNQNKSVSLEQDVQLFPSSAYQAQNGKVLYTFGVRGKEFKWNIKWEITKHKPNESMCTLFIYRNYLPDQPIKLSEIIEILQNLHEKYGQQEFRLDNNVTEVRVPTDQPGFGRMIFATTQSVAAAQTASQLGPILHHAGVLQWNGRNHGIGFTCTDKVVGITEDLLAKLLDAVPSLPSPVK